MKKMLLNIFAIAFLAGAFAMPANAQFGKLKKLAKKVEKIHKDVKKDVEKVADAADVPQMKGEFTRVKPEAGSYDAAKFLWSDIAPREHADWNKQTPTGKLKEHLGFLVAKQIEYLNDGNWDMVAEDFKKHSQPMWLVYKELMGRGEDMVWTEKRLGDLRQIQRQHLFPGIQVYDRQGFTDCYQTGDYDWKAKKISKEEFYKTLRYYIDMAKQEKTPTLKYMSTSEAIFWRGDGAMNPGAFKGVPLYGDDAEWIEADKDLTVLCKEVGIKSLVTFEQIEAYKKQLDAKALKDAMKKNVEMIPKSTVNDPQAAKFAAAEFNKVMNGKAVADKVFVCTGWQETTNSLGITISRAKYMVIIAKHTDGIYRLHKCRLVAVTQNNAKSWSNSMFSVDAIKGNREGYPVEWKK